MSHSLWNRIFRSARKCYVFSSSLAYDLHFLEFPQPFSSSSSSSSSSCVSNDSGKQSSTVSYLTSSFGFSLERALTASKYLDLETPKMADPILAFLKKHQFNDDQIATVIKQRPQILKSRPKTVLPKIDFLKSIGFSASDIPPLLCVAPNIFARSLSKKIIPIFNLLKNSLHSHEDVLFAIKRYPRLLSEKIQFAPNIEILRQADVPECGVRYCIKHHPMLLATKKPEKLRKYIEQVKQMGFPLEKNMFLQGVVVLALSKKSTWERKIEVYKECGWSEEEVMKSFRRHPHCMRASDSKIAAVVDILVHKMGYSVCDLVRYPAVVLLSLEKRIVPRYQVLVSKGLAKTNLHFGNWLLCTEELFLRRHVLSHVEQAPELLKLYEAKLGRKVSSTREQQIQEIEQL